MRNFKAEKLPACVATLPPEDPEASGDTLKTMVFTNGAQYWDIIDQIMNLKKVLYPDELKIEQNDKSPKDKLREVTYDNFEDICTDKKGFCMLSFLKGNHEETHEKHIETLKRR